MIIIRFRIQTHRMKKTEKYHGYATLILLPVDLGGHGMADGEIVRGVQLY